MQFCFCEHDTTSGIVLVLVTPSSHCSLILKRSMVIGDVLLLALIFFSVCVCVPMCRACMFVCVSVNVCMCVSVYVCVLVSVHAYERVCACFCVCVCPCACARAYRQRGREFTFCSRYLFIDRVQVCITMRLSPAAGPADRWSVQPSGHLRQRLLQHGSCPLNCLTGTSKARYAASAC